MKPIMKKTGLSLYGLLQGSLGSYLALIGLAFAIPESEPGSLYYEEDLFFAPLGYFLMLAYLAAMVITFVLLRKNRANLLFFSIPWLIGLGVYAFFCFYIY